MTDFARLGLVPRDEHCAAHCTLCATGRRVLHNQGRLIIEPAPSSDVARSVLCAATRNARSSRIVRRLLADDAVAGAVEIVEHEFVASSGLMLTNPYLL